VNVWQSVRIAVNALRVNKLRSVLTMLGIIIGVGAVIAMVAIGEGAKAQVAQTFAQMGTNVLIVLPGSSSAGGARGGFGSQPTLTWDDLKAIQTEVPSVHVAAPQLRTSAQVLSDAIAMATHTSPSAMSWTNTGPAVGSTNCGSTATKNASDLGLVTPTTNPSTSIRYADLRSAGLSSTAASDLRWRMACTPR